MRLIVAGEDRSHLIDDQRHVSTALAVCRLKASD